MHLGMFLQGAGHHVAGWRHPDADSGSENLPHLIRQAVTAERAKFDMVFLADGLTSSEDGHPSQIARFEPLTVLTAFAMATSRIGLAATASTTYGEPFHLARAFASLDHIGRPRRLERGDHVLRLDRREVRHQASGSRRPLRHRRGVHRRGARAVGLVGRQRLSEGQDDGRLRRPVEAPRHRPQGEYFSVKGPLNTSRSPQGHPIIVQSGSSEPGQQLAARTADVVFTAHQSLESAHAFYRELKGRVAAFGRKPESLAIMPGFCRARRHRERGAGQARAAGRWTDQSKVVPMLSDRLGHDVSGYDLDGPLPELPASDQLQSRAKLLTDAARRDNLTLRQLAQMVATGRGHYVMCGTPEQIADRMALVPRGRGRRLQRDAAVFPWRSR